MADYTPVSKGPDAYRSFIGATVGEYRLEQLLEETETGPVFLARAQQTEFQVRLLTVPPDLSSQDRMVLLGRFQREANLVAALQHPGLLPLLDYGIYQNQPYLVSPRFPMRSLSAQLSKHGAFDPLLASRYLDQIADALEYAHAQAVLHLSLSTDCVYLKEDRSLVVANLGLVRMLGSDGKNLGSGSSPAPEQLLGKPVDSYTDVYALGALLYRMLTGHRVFRGGSPEEMAQQHLNAPVPPLSKWRAGLSPQVDTVIAKAMAKDPAQRFRQPGLLANAYHDIVAPNDTQRKAFAVRALSQVPAPAQNAAGAAAPAPLAARPRSTARAARSNQARGTDLSRRRVLIAGGGAAVAIVAVTVFAGHYLIGNTSPSGVTTVPPGSSTKTSGGSSGGSGGSSGSGGSGGQGGTVIARASDVPVNSAKTFPLQNQSNPGILVHLQNGSFVAFNSTCTHAGCAVGYNSQDHLLECPCHGASFDPAKGASVVNGPAQTPLASIRISVNSGTITAQE